MKKHKRITRMAAILFVVLLAFAPCAEAASRTPYVPIGRSGTVLFSKSVTYTMPDRRTFRFSKGWHSFVKTKDGDVHDVYSCTFPRHVYNIKVCVYHDLNDPIEVAAAGNRPH